MDELDLTTRWSWRGFISVLLLFRTCYTPPCRLQLFFALNFGQRDRPTSWALQKKEQGRVPVISRSGICGQWALPKMGFFFPALSLARPSLAGPRVQRGGEEAQIQFCNNLSNTASACDSQILDKELSKPCCVTCPKEGSKVSTSQPVPDGEVTPCTNRSWGSSVSFRRRGRNREQAVDWQATKQGEEE